MSRGDRPQARLAAPDSGWAPAALVLLAGLAVIAVRPPIPLDETRYLQVLSGMREGGPILLLDNGRPYPDKPPLLFWLGWLIGSPLGSITLGLRLVPVLASAGCVLLAGRIGRRLGIAHVGWVQAALLLPLVYGGMLLFDSLLTLCVWLALEAWSARRDLAAGLLLGLALLAKGPAALVSYLPLALALAPLRVGGRESGAALAARLLGGVSLGLVLLVAWALPAGWLGPPEFRDELWWGQVAGRMANSFAHDRPWWFYLSVAFLGALPFTPLLLLRPAGLPAPDEQRSVRRMSWAAGAALALFMLFSGKQPHYLLPLAPALAVGVAARMQAREQAERVARWCAASVLLVMCVGWAGAPLWLPQLLDDYGVYGQELAGSRAWHLCVGLCAALALAGVLALAFAPARRPSSWLCAYFCSLAPGFVVGHWALGRLVLPRRIEQALLAEPQAALATYSGRQAGLYNQLTGRSIVDSPRSVEALADWCAGHPGALVISEDKYIGQISPLGLVPLVHDLVRGTPSSLYRVPTEPSWNRDAASRPAPAGPEKD